MRKLTLMKEALLMIVILLSFAVGVVSLSPHILSQSSGGSLRDRAREAGGRYIGYQDADFNVLYEDVGDLARASSAVIIATASDNRCRLSGDERSITTDYQVVALETLKGNIAQGSSVTLSLPGGRVSFGDGTSASIIVRGGYRKIETNKLYVLFVSPAAGGVFVPTGGAQGIFEVPQDGRRVSPSDMRPNDPIVRKHKNKEVQRFIREVRDAIRRDR